LKHQIVRVQSRVRGFLVRSRISHWKKQLFTDFRQKIFFLWKQFDVPLLYRSKFWLTFDQPDFFNLGVSQLISFIQQNFIDFTLTGLK
jgi:hypothetical protein